jgi:nitroimidazol reductase NimA-like FMN-containing flavoprotein (pyridoxamine 5'-phosphate oxidase superfamily)
MGGSSMRRGDKEIIDRAEIERIVDTAQVLHLGLIDGARPYVVPLNFARDGDDLWMHSYPGGLKLECIRRNPSVCVEVDHFGGIITGSSACGTWTSRYDSVIGFGTAEIVADEAEKDRGLRIIMRKYSGRDDWEFSMLERTAVIRVRLESLSGKHSPKKA